MKIMDMFYKRRKSSVGLDIRNNSVICTELTSSPNGYRLIGLGEAPIEGTTQDAKTGAIRKAFENGKLRPKYVNVALSGPSTVVRYIELPKMTDAELANAIEYETEKYIPFKIDEVEFDFQRLEPQESKGENLMVLLVAAKKEDIEGVLNLAKEVGCELGVIDVRPISIVNCFEVCGPSVEEGEVISLVDIGLEYANLNILWGKTPYFTREIPVKGVVKEAKDKDLSQEGPEGEGVKSALMELINEVRLSFDHFESQTEKSVSSIYMSGEGASIKGLESFLSDQMGIGVKPWSPLEGLEIDKEKVNEESLKRLAGSIAVSIGLGIKPFL